MATPKEKDRFELRRAFMAGEPKSRFKIEEPNDSVLESQPLTGNSTNAMPDDLLDKSLDGLSDPQYTATVHGNYEYIQQTDPQVATASYAKHVIKPLLQDTIRSVHFQRSQSLPHLGEAAKGIGFRRNIDRMRILSGASQSTLARMRHVSRRFSTIGEADENQQRGNWDNPIEFFLSCLGYAVGLGNVWRFPYLCYTNGGGAFLIPYSIMLFGCGLPLMLMELTLGQYSSEGPLTVWKLAPIFKGLGIGMVVCSVLCAVYYNMITGWALYYLYLSLREALPWKCCAAGWATEHCVSFITDGSCDAEQQLLNTELNITTQSNFTARWEANSTAKFAADEFFHNYVLKMSDGIDNWGEVHWDLALALFVAWMLVFVVLMKGVKSVGKMVYFTSTFPYLILTALLVNAVTREGAWDGIMFYLNPKWERLWDAKVWGDAASQIFYSTGVCMGGTITLASYNEFKNNLYRDALIVAVGNSLTSIFSGFVVFSILGFMANSQNTTIAEIVTDGPGLTFITYPQAVVLFPASPVWSVLFFLMLVTLALSTMFPTTENIATSILDQFPNVLRPYKFWVTLLTCLVMFCLGLPLCTGAGMYILQIMDGYGVGYALLILGCVEILVVAWRYGAERLLDNIQTMIGYRPPIIWVYIWRYLTPGLLGFAIIFTLLKLKPLSYGPYVHPSYATAFGFFMTTWSLLPIVLYALYYYVWYLRTANHHGATGLYRLRNALINTSCPDEDSWGPVLLKYKFKGQKVLDDDEDVFH